MSIFYSANSAVDDVVGDLNPDIFSCDDVIDGGMIKRGMYDIVDDPTDSSPDRLFNNENCEYIGKYLSNTKVMYMYD